MVDPKSERVALISGIGEAPVNDRGLIEFSAEVVIVRPTGRSSGTLFCEAPNRGRNLNFRPLTWLVEARAFPSTIPATGFS